MKTTLKLRIFRFNAKTDYLPYYKKYNINTEKNITLKDVLEQIKKEDILFDFPQNDNSFIFVNNHATSTQTPISHICEYFGEELTLEPLSKKRAIKDLIIDDKDFQDTLLPVSHLLTAEQKEQYQMYKPFYYASEVLFYHESFFGTSLFLFVHELLQDSHKNKEELLRIIADEDSGIRYHTPLCHRIFPKQHNIEEKIINLKQEILSSSVLLKKAV